MSNIRSCDRKIRMNQFILPATISLVLVAIVSFHSGFAYNDPNHCHGYNACVTVGYNDGYSDAQNGISPAYACVGHSSGWCDGYNDGFRAGNGGSNIYYGPNTGQSASIAVHGNNNKISINQRSSSEVGDNKEFQANHKESTRAVLPSCLVLCLNSDISVR